MDTNTTFNDLDGFDCNKWFEDGDRVPEADLIPASLVSRMTEILDGIRQNPSSIGESVPALKALIDSNPTLVSLYARANVMMLGLMVPARSQAGVYGHGGGGKNPAPNAPIPPEATTILSTHGDMNYLLHSGLQFAMQTSTTLFLDYMVNDKWEYGKAAEIVIVVTALVISTLIATGATYAFGNNEYLPYSLINGGVHLSTYLLAQFLPNYRKAAYPSANAAITLGLVPLIGGQF